MSRIGYPRTPHGYVSASWYGEDTIPTWNDVTLHVRGTPQLLDDAMAVLRRTVDAFESAVPRPWSLDRLDDSRREMAAKVVAFGLQADSSTGRGEGGRRRSVGGAATTRPGGR